MSEILNKIKSVPPHYLLVALGSAALLNYVLELSKGAGISIYFFFNKYTLRSNTKKLLENRNKKIDEFISRYGGALEEERIEYIISLSAMKLAEEIRKQQITSKEACIAYCLRAGTIGRKLEVIADVCFNEAIIEAEEADKMIRETVDKSTLPSLIGLPVSFKDGMRIKGMVCAMGYQANAQNITKPFQESHVVEVLRRLGAIPYCQTNTPQNTFSIESSNKVWGKSQNPWGRNRTTGGSSGGCSGLVSSLCSPISFNGDVGGSIRIPASYTGLYGIKPSHNRVSSKEYVGPDGSGTHALPIWFPAKGILSRNFDDCLEFAKLIYGNFNKDYNMIQRPFNQKEYDNGLNSLYSNDGTKARIAFCKGYKIAPAIDEQIESLNKVKDHFSSSGYETVDFDFDQFLNIYNHGMRAQTIISGPLQLMTYGEPMAYYYKFFSRVWNLSNLRKNIEIFCLRLIGRERTASRYDLFDHLQTSTYNFMRSYAKLQHMKQEFYNYIHANKIDAIIMPIFPYPAPLLDESEYQIYFLYYTIIVNMLDLSACAVPIKLIENTNFTCPFNDDITRKVKKSLATAKGLPYGFQILTLPYQDEKCLRISKEVDSVFKFSENKQAWDILRENIKKCK